MKAVVVLFAVSACGRLGFGGNSAGSDAAADGPVDGARPAMHVQTIAPPYVSAQTLSVSINVSGGNLLVAATYWDTTQDTISLSDTSNLTWTGLETVDNPSCFTSPKTSGARLFYARAAETGAITVTLTQSSTLNRSLGMQLFEYANLGDFDASSAQTAPATSNAMTPGPVTTTAPALVVALYLNTNNQGTMVPGPGWVQRAIDPLLYSLVSDNLPGADAGVVTPMASLPVGISEQCWVAAAAAFRLL